MQFLLYNNPQGPSPYPGTLTDTKNLNRFAVETMASIIGRESETIEYIPVPKFEFMSLHMHEMGYVCAFTVRGDGKDFGSAVVQFPRRINAEDQAQIWDEWFAQHGVPRVIMESDIARAVILTKPLDFVDQNIVYAILEAAVAAFLEDCED